MNTHPELGEMPRYLYHGTAARSLPSIRQHGIAPRSVTRRSNWRETIESNPRTVYLTDTYPVFFAISARPTVGARAVIEIDTTKLDRLSFIPDEDAIEQSLRSGDNLPAHWSMKERTRHYRAIAPDHPEKAPHSLRALGTCGYYGTIPPAAITRIVEFEIDGNGDRDLWHVTWIDASIHIHNYRFCASKYQYLTRWLFGDHDEASLSPLDRMLLGEDFLGWLHSVDRNKIIVRTHRLTAQGSEEYAETDVRGR